MIKKRKIESRKLNEIEKSNPLYNIREEFSKRREAQCKKLRKKLYTSKMFYEKYRSKE